MDASEISEEEVQHVKIGKVEDRPPRFNQNVIKRFILIKNKYIKKNKTFCVTSGISKYQAFSGH